MDELIFAREFDRVARLHAARRSTIDVRTGEIRTFGEHHDRVLRLVDAMRRQLGIRPDDRFGVLLGNRSEYGELWHAGLYGGGIINPINSRAHADDIEYMLSDSGAVAVFVAADHVSVVEEMRPRLPRLRSVVVVGGEGAESEPAYEDLIAGGEAAHAPPQVGESDTAVLMYTGGTTGKPKGVVLSQRAVMLNWHRMSETIRPTEDWAILQAVPLFHVGGLLAVTLTHLAGGAVAYLAQWEPGAVLDAVEKHGLTSLGAVPTMAVTLIEHPDFAPERIETLRYFGYGAAPMSEGLVRRLLKVLPSEAVIAQAYGLTEVTGMATLLGAEEHRSMDARLLQSVGRPMPGVEVSIRDQWTQEELPPHHAGEIWLRCGSVMTEYWNRPAETADALAGGWLHTGDVGYRDERGYLWLTDRAKDMIITGGENVFSLEVENALSLHPAVSEVAVIARPDERWGETVHAVVRLVSGMSITEAELVEHARSHLAGYKIPRSFTFRSEPFPQSPTGKVRKNDLRAQEA